MLEGKKVHLSPLKFASFNSTKFTSSTDDSVFFVSTFSFVFFLGSTCILTGSTTKPGGNSSPTTILVLTYLASYSIIFFALLFTLMDSA